MLLCSNCNIHNSGRLKTAVDVSAVEIVKITLFLVCNCKLETMVSIVGGFWCLRVLLSVEFSGRQGRRKLNHWVIIVNICFLLFKKGYFHSLWKTLS